MARTKKKSDTAVAEAPNNDTFTDQDTSFNPADFDPAMQEQNAATAQSVVQQVADSTRIDQDEKPKSFADAVRKQAYKPAPDPFGTEFVQGSENSVRLLKSTADAAWVIRFEKNPNDTEGHSKENPHPVLAYLKSEGYRWGWADADGQAGWGKPMQEGHYTYAEHMDARKVLAKAAEMIGAQKEAAIPL